MRRKVVGILIAFSVTLCGCTNPKLEENPDLTQYADQLIDNNYLPELPGVVVAVAKGDEIIYQRAHGFASVELQTPLSEDSVLRIASVTKQLTAAGVLYLSDKGELSLDDPLSRFFPEYPNGNEVSVRQLLNHTSGIFSYTNLPGLMEGPIRLDRSTDQLIEQFKNESPDFSPGAEYRYNNSGYVLLGAIIEKVTGKPWYEYLQQEILLPNDIKHIEYGGNSRLIFNQVPGYTLNAGNLAPAGLLSMTQPHAAGALVSTVGDLVRWNQLLHRGKLLAPESYEQMITPTGSAEAVGYGFGIHKDQFRNETMLHHGGGIQGFSSYLLYLPQSDISVVVLQNSDTKVFGEYSHKDIAMRVAAFAINKPFLTGDVESLSSSSMKALEGVYQSGSDTITLHVLGDVMILNKDDTSLTSLFPLSGQTFVYPDGYSSVAFDDDNGSVKLTLTTMADANGQVFERISTSPDALLKEISPQQLAKFQGQYEGIPGRLTLRIKDDEPQVRLNDQPWLSIYHIGDRRFFIAETGTELSFTQSQSIEELTVRQNGRKAIMKRIKKQE